MATILAAVLGLFLLSPARGAPAISDQDTKTVSSYLESGGRLPGWAASPGLRRALAAEARAHGLGMLAQRLPPSNGLSADAASLAATLRLARMLASGAVAPGSVEHDWTIPVPAFAPEAALRILVSAVDPLAVLEDLSPQGSDYLELQRALSEYRAIAERGGWPTVSAGPVLVLGATGERVAALQNRLEAEGYLAADRPVSSAFDLTTEQAVRSFQSSHELAVDGRVGQGTLAALNVDARHRYQQIAANMERWRWLPHRPPPTRVMVNAAAARLELIEENREVVQLRTIVGKPRTPTPALTAAISSLLFNPPWDIPSQIAAREIRPLGRRDATYFERQGIVELDNGRRLRQLPGPKNALGHIKFEMPNPLDIYLHDTPDKDLFARRRRFFSHGCIRVANPMLLASLLLRRGGASTPADVQSAVSSGETRRVAVDPPVAVLVVYFTAVAEGSGRIEFLEDVYHRDPPVIDMLFRGPETAVDEAGATAAGCSG